MKPIVFYVDPATPAMLVPFIKRGIESWQVAFEVAGFRNAILAKDALPPAICAVGAYRLSSTRKVPPGDRFYDWYRK